MSRGVCAATMVLFVLSTVLLGSVLSAPPPPDGSGSISDITLCGVAPMHGKQDVVFKSTISYGGSLNTTQAFITTLIVSDATGVVASQTHVINLSQQTGGVNVADPIITVNGLKPGTYTVQALLVHQPLTPAGNATVLGAKACTYTISP